MLSNKPFMNHLYEKRELETMISQAYANLGVSPLEKRVYWLQQIKELDKKFQEFKKKPVPNHNL